MAALPASRIDALIRACTFHEAKARTIREIARRTVAEFGGELPCDVDVLTSFKDTATPEGTMVALERKLPRRYWIEINRLLVPFGKHVCTGRLPRCSTCPVLSYRRQVEVTTHR